MKIVLIIVLLISSAFMSDNFTKILCSHSWKLENIKVKKGTNDPSSNVPISSIINKEPLCGQIITFSKDHSCKVENKGQGGFSDLDNYQWSIENTGLLKFRRRNIVDGFNLNVFSFCQDSIILFSSGIAIETGTRYVNIYKLIKLKG